MTVTRFILLILTALALNILGHVGSVALAENLTRSGASELVKDVRRPCSDDRDCSSNEYCFSRFSRNRYCTACVDCQSQRRKPGWVTCAKTFEECGECLEPYYGYLCGSKREAPSIPTNNVTGASPSSSSSWQHPAVVSTLSVITCVVLFAAVGIFVTSFVRKHKSNDWPWRSKVEFRKDSSITSDEESGISEQTPMSSVGDLHKPTAPDATLLSQPAYNPTYRASSDPLTCELASTSSEVDYGRKRPQLVNIVHEKTQKAFPFELGHSAGPRANRALRSTRRLPSDSQVQAVLNESFTQNPPDDFIPEDQDEPSALSEESFDLDLTNSSAYEGAVRRRSDIVPPQVSQPDRQLEAPGDTNQQNPEAAIAAAVHISNVQNEHGVLATLNVHASFSAFINCPVSWNQAAVSSPGLQPDNEPLEIVGQYYVDEGRFEPDRSTLAAADLMEVDDNPEGDVTAEDESDHVVPTKKLL